MAVCGLRGLPPRGCQRVLVLALYKAWNLECAEVGGRGPGDFPGGGTREWRKQEQRGSLRPPSTDQELYGVPRKLQEHQSLSEYQAVPALLGPASSKRGTVTAPSLGPMGEWPHAWHRAALWETCLSP